MDAALQDMKNDTKCQPLFPRGLTGDVRAVNLSLVLGVANRAGRLVALLATPSLPHPGDGRGWGAFPLRQAVVRDGGAVTGRGPSANWSSSSGGGGGGDARPASIGAAVVAVQVARCLTIAWPLVSETCGKSRWGPGRASATEGRLCEGGSGCTEHSGSTGTGLPCCNSRTSLRRSCSLNQRSRVASLITNSARSVPSSSSRLLNSLARTRFYATRIWRHLET